MAQYTVDSSVITGELGIPPSKSQTLRALLFGAMAHGKTVIRNYLPSPDTRAMVDALRKFGADIHATVDEISIVGVNGTIRSAEDVIHAGNSGIVLRFCAALGALSNHPVVVTGDHSIKYSRPVKPLLEGLQQLGASAYSMRGDGYAPVVIKGPLRSGHASICGEDSQPVSALLIASAFAEGPTEITVKNAGEKPWVRMTLSWFDRLGIPYTNKEYAHYKISGNFRYEGFSYTVPGDLSSLAFSVAAALVTRSSLTIRGVDIQDCQGDKALFNVFKEMGASILIDQEKHLMHVSCAKVLHGVKVDINDFIDSITVLAVVACFAEGETHIHNAAIARHKECDRIACIALELRKMGANIQETKDGLLIVGSPLKGASVDSHNDHRMALALSVAGLGAQGRTVITRTECVAKTYPNFINDFVNIGAKIREEL